MRDVSLELLATYGQPKERVSLGTLACSSNLLNLAIYVFAVINLYVLPSSYSFLLFSFLIIVLSILFYSLPIIQ